MAHAAFTPSAGTYRFYQGDAGEAASTPLVAENTSYSANLDSGDITFQLRYVVQETGGTSGATTDAYALEYSVTGGASWTTVTTGTSYIKGSTSGLTDATATTNRATNGLTDGTGSFVAGLQCTDGTLDNYQLTASNFTEHVYGLTIVASSFSAGSTTVQFRMTLNGGTPGMTNASTPSIVATKSITPSVSALALTAEAPTLAFTVHLTPNASSLTLTAENATISFGTLTLAPTAASLALTGEAPTVGYGTLTLSPSAASLTLTAEDPSLAFSYGIMPSVSTLTFTAENPSLGFGTLTLTPTTPALSLTAENVTLGLTLGLTPTTPSLSLTAENTTLSLNYSLNPGVAALALTANDPNLTVAPAITPDPVDLTFTVEDPTIAVSIPLTPGAVDLGLTSEEITINRIYYPDAVSLNLSVPDLGQVKQHMYIRNVSLSLPFTAQDVTVTMPNYPIYPEVAELGLTPPVPYLDRHRRTYHWIRGGNSVGVKAKRT